MVDSHFSSRLTAALLTASSACELFPGAQVVDTFVSNIDFSCDFLFSQPVDVNAMPLLEENIRSLIKADHPLNISEMMRENAADYLEHLGQPLTAERVRSNKDNIVALVEIEGYRDLCLGYPELSWPSSTKEVGAIKILSIAQEVTYWPELGEQEITRIRGIVSPDPQKLKKSLKQLDQAKQHDHRLLGEEMKLFTSCDSLFNGGYCWQPKGVILRELILQWSRTQVINQNFHFIQTPSLFQSQNQGMLEIEGREYAILPDRIPVHAQLGFENQKVAEWSEKLEEVPRIQRRGLFNTSLSTSDQLSLFGSAQSIQEELISSLHFFDKTIKIFGFEAYWHLVVRKAVLAQGTQKAWNQTASLLVQALQKCQFNFEEDTLATALWGPRIELRLCDARGQLWTGPWMGYVVGYPQGIMLAGALWSSLERFIGLLLERYAGQLPLWLAPEQVRVLPIGTKQIRRAEEIAQQCIDAKLRVGIDRREEKLGAKVHAAERERIPYLLIVGDKEEKESTVTVRSCYSGETQQQITLMDFLTDIKRGVERQVES